MALPWHNKDCPVKTAPVQEGLPQPFWILDSSAGG